jgi:hypothetical protein
MTEAVVLINSFEVPAADAENFIAAISSPGMREAASGLAGYRPHLALYRAVRT